MTGASADIAPSWPSVWKRQALARSVLGTYAVKYNATVIDPLPALCDAKHCHVERDGVVLYRDADHLTARGAHSISYLYNAFFGNLHNERIEAAFGTPHEQDGHEFDQGRPHVSAQ